MDATFEYYLVLVGYGIAIFSFTQIMALAFIRRGEFLTDLKGFDGKWQLVEFGAVVWAILFPTIVIIDVLGVHINTEVWLSLDSLFLANLGKKSFDKYVQYKYSKGEQEDAGQQEQVK